MTMPTVYVLIAMFISNTGVMTTQKQYLKTKAACMALGAVLTKQHTKLINRKGIGNVFTYGNSTFPPRMNFTCTNNLTGEE